ncbi:hypothetical protein BGW38_005628 [Lunasporangiospora selenospora]|uniref:Uncharacterized protein n=1 Tax=Lunasporangiospora selenospora TaxID=979761 RepID=A0A9P6G088_9FUNG|nr:hypothetical protein BGW38_005628 [Lunasporangiospora selenospora]
MEGIPLDCPPLKVKSTKIAAHESVKFAALPLATERQDSGPSPVPAFLLTQDNTSSDAAGECSQNSLSDTEELLNELLYDRIPQLYRECSTLSRQVIQDINLFMRMATSEAMDRGGLSSFLHESDSWIDTGVLNVSEKRCENAPDYGEILTNKEKLDSLTSIPNDNPATPSGVSDQARGVSSPATIMSSVDETYFAPEEADPPRQSIRDEQIDLSDFEVCSTRIMYWDTCICSCVHRLFGICSMTRQLLVFDTIEGHRHKLPLGEIEKLTKGGNDILSMLETFHKTRSEILDKIVQERIKIQAIFSTPAVVKGAPVAKPAGDNHSPAPPSDKTKEPSWGLSEPNTDNNWPAPAAKKRGDTSQASVDPNDAHASSSVKDPSSWDPGHIEAEAGDISWSSVEPNDSHASSSAKDPSSWDPGHIEAEAGDISWSLVEPNDNHAGSIVEKRGDHLASGPEARDDEWP